MKDEKRTASAVALTADAHAQTKENKKAGFWREIGIGMIYSLLSYALGLCTLPFGATPLGIGFLCGVDHYIPFVFAGVLVAALQGKMPVIGVCAAVAAVLVRILVRLTLDPPKRTEISNNTSVSSFLHQIFSESLPLRMATAALASFMVGLYRLAWGGFLYYDLFGAILGMVAATASAALFSFCFSKSTRRVYPKAFAFGALAFFAVSGVRTLTIWGVSVAVFGSMMTLLYLTRKRGILTGMLTGLLCGLAYSPALSPAFVFAALAMGVLCRISVFFACSAAFLVGMAWGVYVEGIGALTSLLPALLAAALLFAVMDKLFFAERLEEHETAEVAEMSEESTVGVCLADPKLMTELRLDVMGQRIKGLCEGFDALSSYFGTWSERARLPVLRDLRQICDDAFDACCATCPHKSGCWEERYDQTVGAVGSISAALHRRGKITETDVPRALSSVCERMSDIVDEINYNSNRYARELILCDKNEIFALDYAAVASLLAQSMTEDMAESEYCAVTSEAICDALKEYFSTNLSAAAYGQRRMQVMLRGEWQDVAKQRGRIEKIVSEACGENMVTVSDEEEMGTGQMRLCSTPRFAVEYARRTASAPDEAEYCGDTVGIWEKENGYVYSLISDGMGSGAEAAQTSGAAAIFLEKLLHVTDRCSVALEMLNGFLRNKGCGSFQECSATVDLLSLDLYDGKASFYKSGAAPSYVLREDGLFKLRSKTLPMGILRQTDIKRLHFDIADGDVIVMVSDGVTGGKEECPCIRSMTIF